MAPFVQEIVQIKRPMSTTKYISPALPTAAGNAARHPLIGTDLWPMHMVDNIHVIPDLIDVTKFTKAVSRALSRFPTLAGRIRHDKRFGTWWVELTNSPVPVLVDSLCHTSAPSPEWTVLPSNFPFVEPIEPTSLVNQDTPPLTIKLSLLPLSGQSIVGTYVSHIVADGHQILQFTRAISDFYQGLEPTLPPYNIPSPFPHLDTPSNEIDWLSPQHFSPKDAEKIYQLDHDGSSQINLRITPEQAESLKRVAISGLATTSTSTSVGFISTQDALSAYWVHIMNHILPEEDRVKMIMNVVNYREALNKVNPSLLGLCGFLLVPVSVPSPDPSSQTDVASSLASTATSIRQSLEKFKDPNTIEQTIIRASEALTKQANDNKTYVVVLEQGWAMINSNARYDWTSPHFGCVGRVQFHTSGTVSRMARIFRSNPVLSGPDDGYQIVDTRKGWLDISFRVPSAFADNFTLAFNTGLNKIL